MVKIGLYEAKTHFSELVDRVSGGESVLITRHGEEVARLVPPIRKAKTKSSFEEAVVRWRKSRSGLSLRGTKVRDLVNEGRR